jgi:hypothetical protein
MTRRWIGAAVVVGCLGLATAARGQPQPPMGVPAGPAMPDPIPCAPSGPNLVPGPISPLAAPPGPCDDLSLPNDNHGAFPCEAASPEDACYFHFGAQGLQRQHLGHGVIAVQEPPIIGSGLVLNTTPRIEQSFNQINQTMNFGPRVTFGRLWANESLEFTGFYIFDTNHGLTTSDRGRINGEFFGPVPSGFEGLTAPFLAHDMLQTTFKTALGSAEVNYRTTNPAVLEGELIVGIRYLDLQEQLKMFFDDAVFEPGIGVVATRGDPRRDATVLTTVKNRFLGPQIGYEYDKSITSWLSAGTMVKCATGGNWLDVDRSLTRGDGRPSFRHKDTPIVLSQVYDLNAFVDFHLLERARLRFGYTAMWLVDAAAVDREVNFNLGIQPGPKKTSSIFWHGPQVELQFLF